jgi:hypothetical protein
MMMMMMMMINSVFRGRTKVQIPLNMYWIFSFIFAADLKQTLEMNAAISLPHYAFAGCKGVTVQFTLLTILILETKGKVTSPNHEVLTVHALTEDMHAVLRVATESAIFLGGSASHTTD